MKKEVKKMSNYKSYDDWVAAILKDNPKQADDFLETSLKDFEKDGDISSLLLALRQIAKSKGGIAQLSEKTSITRESLYKILSKNGNPTLTTLKSVLDGLGYGIALKFVRHS
jgi:probable addiction module antidote protein